VIEQDMEVDSLGKKKEEQMIGGVQLPGFR